MVVTPSADTRHRTLGAPGAGAVTAGEGSKLLGEEADRRPAGRRPTVWGRRRELRRERERGGVTGRRRLWPRGAAAASRAHRAWLSGPRLTPQPPEPARVVPGASLGLEISRVLPEPPPCFARASPSEPRRGRCWPGVAPTLPSSEPKPVSPVASSGRPSHRGASRARRERSSAGSSARGRTGGLLGSAGRGVSAVALQGAAAGTRD